MLGLRRPHELELTLANVLNDIVGGISARAHPEIGRHHEGFDFVPGNRALSPVEVRLVNVMSWETVIRQYVDSVKADYDYVLLDCRPSLGMLVINALFVADHMLVVNASDKMKENGGEKCNKVAEEVEKDRLLIRAKSAKKESGNKRSTVDGYPKRQAKRAELCGVGKEIPHAGLTRLHLGTRRYRR